MRSILFLLLLFLGNCAFAQVRTGNLRTKKIKVESPAQIIDTLSIVPGTFTIEPNNNFELDEVNAVIKWKDMQLLPDSVTVQYRVFPFRINAPLSRWNESEKRPVIFAPVVEEKTGKRNGLFDFGNVQSSGSIDRSLAVGNSQDAVLNSGMNLQLSGYLTDSVQITALISDNNIPIQPEGNTQRLNEFDKIFLQLKKNYWEANFGDIDIRESRNYFLKFYKRLQGASFSNTQHLGKNASTTYLLSGALAKGKFTKNILQVREGNQGPYHLVGAENEIFFIILANTERVYIDGQLMQRGEDQDYVINYNTAEITFTARQLMTKDKRVQVEFEYADRNYLNTQMFAIDELKLNNKTNLRFGAFINSDAKNSSIDRTLSAAQKQFLFNVGDSIEQAFYPSGEKAAYQKGQIQYVKRDTVNFAGIHDSVYVQSTDSTAILYNLAFSYVGAGMGNYTAANTLSNGKVYQWISPDANGRPQGDWEPQLLLTTPKRRQIFTFGIDQKINDFLLFTGDAALSDRNLNLFSSKNKSDDKTWGGKLQLENTGKQITLFSRPVMLTNRLGYEQVQQNFSPVERLRDIEFLRDWALPFAIRDAEEKILTAASGLADSAGNKLVYRFEYYRRNDKYSGIRHLANIAFTSHGFLLNSNPSFLNYSKANSNGTFSRPDISLRKIFPRFRNYGLAAAYHAEINKEMFSDSISTLSFAFHTQAYEAHSDLAKPDYFRLSYLLRKDQLPDHLQLRQADRSKNLNLEVILRKNENRQLSLTAGYRSLEIDDPKISRQTADETILSRIDYNFSELNDFIRGNLFYETGGGQEPKRIYSYVEVPTGQGQYTWNDYNQNGLAELNEFEIALYPDQRRYIRIFAPGTDYIKANYVQFNYALQFDFSRIVKPDNYLHKILAGTQLNSSLQMGKKISDIDKRFFFNPFQKNLADTNLIHDNTFFSNSIFFNRNSPKWGFDFTHSKSPTKVLLSYGLESRLLRNMNLRIRYALKQKLTAFVTFKDGRNVLQSPVQLANRNYHIDSRSAEPSLTWLASNNFRMTTSLLFQQKQNRMDSMERARFFNINSDIKYNLLSSASVAAKFTFSQIGFNAYPGAKNSVIGYTMLDGLEPGKNFLWNIEILKRISSGLEMSINYDARKPGNLKTIHTGRAGIRAIL